jgi:hypothetical protein
VPGIRRLSAQRRHWNARAPDDGSTMRHLLKVLTTQGAIGLGLAI